MALIKKFKILDGVDVIGTMWKDGKEATRAIVSNTAPSDPADGNLWYDIESGKMYTYYTDADSGQWVEFGTT